MPNRKKTYNLEYKNKSKIDNACKPVDLKYLRFSDPLEAFSFIFFCKKGKYKH